MDHAVLERRIEETLRERILFIGDNKQVYTGYPAQLIAELVAAIEKEART